MSITLGLKQNKKKEGGGGGGVQKKKKKKMRTIDHKYQLITPPPPPRRATIGFSVGITVAAVSEPERTEPSDIRPDAGRRPFREFRTLAAVAALRRGWEPDDVAGRADCVGWGLGLRGE